MTGFLNLPEFNRELRDWASRQVPEAVVKLQRRMFFELVKRVIPRTPADTGEHRGGWRANIGGPAPDGGAPDKDGGPTIEAALQVAAQLRPFQSIHLTNHKRAIRVLEEGGFIPQDPGPSKDPRPGRKGRVLVKGGFSVQAPRGMVAITLAELRRIFGP